MAVGWFIAFIILLIIELITVGLVTIWFAIGAIAAIIATIFTDSIICQTGVFLIVSLISLFVTKPFVKKFKKFDVTPTNSDRVIGKIGEVTKKITHNKYGEVSVLGSIWTATCDEELEEGDKVRILAIEGVKLIVKKEEE